jgi:alpha-mannosidase
VLLSVPAALAGNRQSRVEEQTDLRIRYELTRDLAAGVTWIAGCVHNTARDHRLRIILPTPAADNHSWSGAPFHIERRPVKLKFDPDEFSERPLTDYPFVDYIRYGGWSVYSQSNGEYQITPRGIEITLCRSVGWIGRPDLSYRKAQGGPFLEAPLAQLVATDIPFGLVVAPTLPDPVADYRRKELLGDTITQCVLAETSPSVRARLPVRVHGAELSALRWLSEREIEVRLFNPQATPATVHLSAEQPLTELWEVNLNHERIPNGYSCSNPHAVTLALRPFQVLTLQAALLRLSVESAP